MGTGKNTIREYQNQGKKTHTDISIPTLKNPVRGFGLKPLDTSPSALPEAQVQGKPPGHDISKISLRRPEQSISQPQDCDEQHFSIVQQLFRRMEAERISRSYVQPGEMSTPEAQQSQTEPLVDMITPVVQRQQASQQQQQLNTDAVQLKCSQCEEKEKRHHADEETQLRGDDLDEQVQLKANGDNGAKSIQQLAAQGFSGSATTIPHLNQIQQSFGVNLSQVQAYIGSDAAAACQQMGADAYASGNQIAFKEAPSVELAAHEAAHVVQQASGKVQLSGGVGKVGDKYEQQADDVAARAAAGQSAGDLLGEYTSTSVTQESIQAQTSEIIQQQLVAPPPVAPPPVSPGGTTTPNPATLWLLPWLYLPGLLGNPWPTANDQIDPKTGLPRFPNKQPQPPQRPKPPTQDDVERARQRQPKPQTHESNKEEPCTTEGLKKLKNCNSIKDKIVRRGVYPPETPYGQYRYNGLPGQASSYALGALINRIKNNRGSISGRIQITKSDPSQRNVGLCTDGGGSHHEVRDEARNYVASIICCECCQKDPKTQEEKKSEYCALLPKRIVPDAGILAPQGALPKNNSSIATSENSDVVKQV